MAFALRVTQYTINPFSRRDPDFALQMSAESLSR